jgi:TonB-dependent receptor
MVRHHYPLLAGAIATALSLSAASAWAGDISGRVTEASSGRALPNATVRVPQLGRSVQADRSGDYRLDGVPAGTHAIEVDYVGLPGTKGDITVPETGAVERNFALGTTPETLGVEEITVTGYRLAQITALQDKKSSQVIKESVTADDAGKLPDQNAGETLARVVGVAVTTDQGEGRYVTIRGIDAALSNVTIDGQIIGSPEGDTRRVALDTVPANILSKLEVVKSATPDLDGNAIGGTINLVTPSVFDDPDGRFFSGTADYGYYDLGGQNPWGGSVGWGNIFNERFGIVLSASYSDREFNSHNVQGGDPWVEDEEAGQLLPDEFTMRDYLIRRVRKGFVANLEFRPNDDLKFHWRNLYNRYEDTELQPEVTLDYRNGDLEDQTPTSGTFTEGEGERINTKRFEIQSILSSTLGADLTIGDWNLAGSFTYGETKQDTPFDIAYSFETADELPMTYDVSDRFWRVDAGPDFENPDNFEFSEAARGGQLIEEDLRIGQVDLKRAFNWNDREGFVKFGAKHISRESTSDQDMIVYDGFDGDYLLSEVSQPGDPSFYRSERSYYSFGPYPNFGRADQFFRANEGTFEISDADTIAESFGVDYRVKETITAGYLMGQLQVGSASFIAGARVERTDTDFDAYEIEFVDGDSPNPPPQVRGQKDYTNVLPDVLMTWAIQENLLLRAAWTNTIGRPSYEQNVPFRIFEIELDDEGDPDDPTDDEFEGAIEAGNSDLDPLESTNYDVALEWYLEPAGLLSAGVFYKDIENPIFNRIQVLEDAEFEGRFYSELEVQQFQNATSGEILGIELGFQQQFTSLPGLLRGLGISLSYTWTDSESDVQVLDTMRKVPFFLQSEHIGNIALFYEVNGIELRLAYAYRSEYLDAIGDTADQDLYVDTHGQLDFKASYQFSKQASAFIQWQNINDEPLRFYSGDRSRLAENEIYSWNMLAGMTFKF